MGKLSRPRIYSPCAAHRSIARTSRTERIAEFSCGESMSDYCGGLIGLRNFEGKTRLQIYSVSEDGRKLEVTVDPRYLMPAVLHEIARCRDQSPSEEWTKAARDIAVSFLGNDLRALVEAAQTVVEDWESSDLQYAVRALDDLSDDIAKRYGLERVERPGEDDAGADDTLLEAAEIAESICAEHPDNWESHEAMLEAIKEAAAKLFEAIAKKDPERAKRILAERAQQESFGEDEDPVS